MEDEVSLEEYALQEQRRLWDGFLSHPSWKEIQSTMLAQMEARVQNVMFNPLEALDGALAVEFQKGEYAAFKLIEALPNLQLELITNQLNLLKENQDVES